jgi:hypothetical protein
MSHIVDQVPEAANNALQHSHDNPAWARCVVAEKALLAGAGAGAGASEAASCQLPAAAAL